MKKCVHPSHSLPLPPTTPPSLDGIVDVCVFEWLADDLVWYDSPDVEFCGYSIPHPAEPKMNLRIQTYGEFLSCLLLLLEKFWFGTDG